MIRQKNYYKCMTLVLMSSVLGFLQAAIASQERDTQFTETCRRLLPQADSFAETCRKQARPFSRVFLPGVHAAGKGEVENYWVYFHEENLASSFLLGCVLNFKKQIDYVGLFYGMAGNSINLNSSEISFVDPDDNIGLIVNGKWGTFLAVRQFASASIPLRLIGRPKNCENPKTPGVSFKPVSAGILRFCSGYDVKICQDEHFITRGNRSSSPLPLFADFDALFVSDDGSISLNESFEKRACGGQNHNVASKFGVFHEACSSN